MNFPQRPFESKRRTWCPHCTLLACLPCLPQGAEELFVTLILPLNFSVDSAIRLCLLYNRIWIWPFKPSCDSKCKLQISYYPLPSGLFRDNLQHWLGDFARLLKVQFTSNEEMSNDAPIHEWQSGIGHYTWHYGPYSLRRVCGFFNVLHFYYMCKGLWVGA